MSYTSEYKDATAVVTGGAGAIGSCLVETLIRAGASKVIIVDDLSSSYEWNIVSHPAVEFIHESILDDSLIDCLRSKSFQYLFHLAALFANQNSVDHPQLDLQVNGLGTLQMLELARFKKVKRFVYASSSSSFSKESAPLPLHEEFLSLKLDTPYQITKLLGEYYCNFYQQHWGVPTVRLRFFNSYGPGEVPGKYRNVIPNFLLWALRGQPLPITGTGEETRDFTYIEDIVQGMLAAAACPAACGDVFNLASAKETRVIDLANLINDLTGNSAGIIQLPRRDWDHTSRRWASIDKARRVFGYQPQTNLNVGLSHALAWFRENWTRIELAQGPNESSSNLVLAKVA